MLRFLPGVTLWTVTVLAAPITGSGHVGLGGPTTFTITGSEFSIASVAGTSSSPLASCPFGFYCFQVNFGLAPSGPPFGQAEATFQGQRFVSGGCCSSLPNFQGELDVSPGAVVFDTVPPTTLTLPVVVQGRLFADAPLAAGGTQRLFDVLISGSGSLELLRGAVHEGFFYFDSGTFQFTGTETPTPEPATCLLVTTGLAVAGVCRRRSRRRLLSALSAVTDGRKSPRVYPCGPQKRDFGGRTSGK